MEVGISTACFFGKALLEDSLPMIRKTEAELCEVFINAPSESDPAFIRSLKESADSLGLKIGTMHPFGIQYELQLFSNYPRTVDDARKIYERNIAAAQALGAEYYIFHGGTAFKFRSKNTLNYKNIGKNLDVLMGIAEDYGVRLAYENVYWCWYSFPEFCDMILNEVTNDNLCFNLDIKQAVFSGYETAEYIKHMGSRLKNVHICGVNCKEGEFRTCMPEHGDYPLSDLKKELLLVGYSGNIILEVYSNNYDSLDDLKKSFITVRSCFDS